MALPLTRSAHLSSSEGTESWNPASPHSCLSQVQGSPHFYSPYSLEGGVMVLCYGNGLSWHHDTLDSNPDCTLSSKGGHPLCPMAHQVMEAHLTPVVWYGPAVFAVRNCRGAWQVPLDNSKYLVTLFSPFCFLSPSLPLSLSSPVLSR